MKNFELVTIKKGEIKTVDAFIKSFNAVGSNMRALSVSAYKFLTDDNVEVRKEFKTRCLDELNMSNASISFLKTSSYVSRLITTRALPSLTATTAGRGILL